MTLEWVADHLRKILTLIPNLNWIKNLSKAVKNKNVETCLTGGKALFLLTPEENVSSEKKKQRLSIKFHKYEPSGYDLSMYLNYSGSNW